MREAADIESRALIALATVQELVLMKFEFLLATGVNREVAAARALDIIGRFLQTAEIPDHLQEYREALRAILVNAPGFPS